jgi:hypothetical protein
VVGLEPQAAVVLAGVTAPDEILQERTGHLRGAALLEQHAQGVGHARLDKGRPMLQLPSPSRRIQQQHAGEPQQPAGGIGRGLGSAEVSHHLGGQHDVLGTGAWDVPQRTHRSRAQLLGTGGLSEQLERAGAPRVSPVPPLAQEPVGQADLALGRLVGPQQQVETRTQHLQRSAARRDQGMIEERTRDSAMREAGRPRHSAPPRKIGLGTRHARIH